MDIIKCNVEVVELTDPLEVIDLAPYTCEIDYYIEQCIIEELPVARYTDGLIVETRHINQ